MAFQQPQRHPIPRHSSLNTPAAALQPVLTAQSATREPLVEQSQEWVLFSQEQSQTEAASTESHLTLGRTHDSDAASLKTAAPSEHNDDTNPPDRDNDDLDSLDDGLHEFSEDHDSHIVVDETAQPVLPQHDGLGMFPGSSAAVQEQHWQHERHNPRRRRLSARRSSLQRRVEALDQVEEPRTADEERTQRIEKWRLDQSRAVLDEIERETRRLRQRGRLSDSHASQAAMDSSSSSPLRSPAAAAPAPRPSAPEEAPSESLWERFKRRVIKEFMGIDDATLSFIFGEALPSEGTEDEVRTRRLNILQEVEHNAPDDYALARTSDHWEERLLARIAKELGVLLHQLSEHPGAFSSYLRTQEPLPYAGLVTPRASTVNLRNDTHKQPGPQPPSTPHFAPTLPLQQRPSRPLHRRSSGADTASLWGIEEEDDAIEPSMAYQMRNAAKASGTQTQQLQREQEYWERDLDIKMVFGYLRNRLSSTSPSSSPPKDSSQDPADNTTPDPAAALVSSAAANYMPPTTAQSNSLRRAALIRHHHPLVNRNHAHNTTALASSPARSLQFQHNHPHYHHHRHGGSSALSAPLSPILGRRDSSSRSLLFDDDEELGRGLGAGMSSCASQSKKSKTQHSASLGGGSSRNYWDLGAGSVGSWGEV